MNTKRTIASALAAASLLGTGAALSIPAAGASTGSAAGDDSAVRTEVVHRSAQASRHEANHHHRHRGRGRDDRGRRGADDRGRGRGRDDRGADDRGRGRDDRGADDRGRGGRDG